jgi:diguanylate cyclase (GGDEF)-like protein
MTYFERRTRMAKLPLPQDDLTGCFTRKAFQEYFRKLLVAAEPDQSPPPFSLAMVDIDSFLQVNERYGHVAGDNVIKAIADALAAGLPEQALLFRYGGDEYAIIFPRLEREQAFLTLEKARSEVEQLSVPAREGETVSGLTISGGVASYPIDGRIEAELLRKADQALYRAKYGGRNRIRLAYEERMVPKTTHFTVTQLERLTRLSSQRGVGEAELLREALDELLSKYGVDEIER